VVGEEPRQCQNQSMEREIAECRRRAIRASSRGAKGLEFHPRWLVRPIECVGDRSYRFAAVVASSGGTAGTGRADGWDGCAYVCGTDRESGSGSGVEERVVCISIGKGVLRWNVRQVKRFRLGGRQG
jgi:hypothetical protein